MSVITPQFVADFETNFFGIRENEYLRLSASENQWWDKVATKRTSVSKRDVVSFILSTAMIRELDSGGHLSFESLSATYTEIETKFAGDGFSIERSKLEDIYNGEVGGEARMLAEEWATQIAAQQAYWPQQQVAEFLMNAHDAGYAKGYDGKAYFASDHPVNPFNTAAGTYSNLLSHTDYNISESATSDAILEALRNVYKVVRGWKMPNGKQPRMLRPAGILCSPALAPKIAGAIQASFIAMTGGSEDKTGFVRRMGYAPPIEAAELAGFENDTTYYVIMERITESQLGGVIYCEREGFRTNQYSPMTDAELSRTDRFEWHTRGRNAVSPGHPYFVVKVKHT